MNERESLVKEKEKLTNYRDWDEKRDIIIIIYTGRTNTKTIQQRVKSTITFIGWIVVQIFYHSKFN